MPLVQHKLCMQNVFLISSVEKGRFLDLKKCSKRVTSAWHRPLWMSIRVEVESAKQRNTRQSVRGHIFFTRAIVDTIAE